MTGQLWPLRRVMTCLVPALMTITLVLAGFPVAASPLASEAAVVPCEAQQAQWDSVQREIKAHNAKPHVFQLPRQQAQLNAYNAEKARLTAAQDAARQVLQACLNALERAGQVELERLRELEKRELLREAAHKALDPQQSPENTPSWKARAKELEAAQRKVPADWTPPPRDPTRKSVVERTSPARELYEVLRTLVPPRPAPDEPLQGLPRPKVGDPIPSHPGRTINARADGSPNVSADHIIPLTELINMPGFARLTPANMLAVSSARLNYQWMSSWVNSTKSSRSVGLMRIVDPEWRDAQVALEDDIRPRLRQLIDRLLESQE